VTSLGGSATGFTTAKLTGTVDTGDESTTYRWIVQDVHTRANALTTPTATLAPSSAPQAVEGTIAGLQPGTTYDVGLAVENAQGGTNDWRYSVFTTPQRSHLTFEPLRRDEIKLDDLTLRATFDLTGLYSRYAALDLYASPFPYRRWKLINGEVLPARHGFTRVPLCPLPSDPTSCGPFDRNFKLRGQQGDDRSRTRTVYVDPLLSVGVDREKSGYSPWLDASLNAAVHHLTHFHTQRVYFYEGPGHRGPFTLEASRRLTVVDNLTDENAELQARVRFRYTAAGTTIACFRHPLVPDMGRPFLARWCGRPALPRR
jgi:hypothetical protein